MTAVIEGSCATVARSVAEYLGAGLVPRVVRHSTGDGVDVVGWLLVEGPDVVSVGERRCAVVEPSGSVVCAGLVSTVLVAEAPETIAELAPAWAEAVATATWRAQRAEQRLEGELVAWERRIEAAHDAADARGHCREFDDIMEEIGLPGRRRDFDVEVVAEVLVSVRVEARTADEARGEVSEAMVADAIYAMDRNDVYCAIEDQSVRGVDRAD
ncbi:hypothetical protein E3G68_005345 [Mycobacteroides abscessus]|uniref:hypothetical protein n=1 Tax=Mycobacteroides abscessus TaxID=36809 RepID=UPI0018775665|nr:hypothetical protein [Mycobacteroides abscessus]